MAVALSVARSRSSMVALSSARTSDISSGDGASGRLCRERDGVKHRMFVFVMRKINRGEKTQTPGRENGEEISHAF